MPTASTIELLATELDDIEEELARLISISPTRWLDRNLGAFYLATSADYNFESPGADQSRIQLPLKRKYDAWFERFQLLFASAPSDLSHRIKDAHESLAKWIDLGRDNYRITDRTDHNVNEARQALIPMREFLGLVRGPSEVIIIPDTNALTSSPDPQAYSHIAGVPAFTFLLLPTVLSELDNLKIHARDQAYREKVADAIRRIKGWRTQGSLSQGITLHKTITVRAIAREPNVQNTLSWLDPSNRDDRIVASALEIQSSMPNAAIILVTGDVNLQNKAEAAKLPYSDPP